MNKGWTLKQCKIFTDWAKERYKVDEKVMKELRAYAEAHKKKQASTQAPESKAAAN